MTEVFLSFGSNIDRARHIQNGIDALKPHLSDFSISTVYESESVGFDGENFYNLVLGGHTSLSLLALSETLRNIENANGRRRDVPKFSARTLDIDILLYGELVGNHSGIHLPREEITKNAFVLLPLSEIAPQKTHPVVNKTYSDLWQNFDKGKQALWAIDLDLSLAS